MKNILIAIDFEKTNLLVDEALKLLDYRDSKLWLLHAAAPNPDFVGYEAGPKVIRDLRAKELKEEHNDLSEQVKKIKAKGIDADGLLIQGATVETIIKESKKLNIDVIVIGYNEHSFIYHLIFNDTAIQLVKKSTLPVLVVPLE